MSGQNMGVSAAIAIIIGIIIIPVIEGAG